MQSETVRSIRYSQCGGRLRQPAITQLMASALRSPGLLSLAAGFTDNATLPVGPVSEVVGEILSKPEGAEFLQYGMNQGRPVLRDLLAERISRLDRLKGVEAFEGNQVLITNGSQQALALASLVLCDPGDIVFVENPTYFVYLDVLRGVGAEIRDLPRDGRNRLDGEAFGRLLDRMEPPELRRVKAVYLLGYFSNPASTTLTEEEKIGIADALRARGLRVPVIEDAAYRDLYFENEPGARSVLALEAFRDFPRLYLGTLTKTYATGLKTGFAVCTDEDWLQRMLYLKGQHDFGTAHFVQAILEEVLVSGRFEPQLGLLRGTYFRKMRVLHETLIDAGLADIGWKWEVPEGGLYLWLEGPEGIDTSAESDFCRRGVENGVIYVPGDLCMGERPDRRFVRLTFAALSEDQLREAGERFAKTALEFALAQAEND